MEMTRQVERVVLTWDWSKQDRFDEKMRAKEQTEKKYSKINPKEVLPSKLFKEHLTKSMKKYAEPPQFGKKERLIFKEREHKVEKKVYADKLPKIDKSIFR